MPFHCQRGPAGTLTSAIDINTECSVVAFITNKRTKPQLQDMDQNKINVMNETNTGLSLEIARALYGFQKAYEVLVGGRSIVKTEQSARELMNLSYQSGTACSKRTESRYRPSRPAFLLLVSVPVRS